MAGRTLPISGQIEPKSFPFLVADLHRNGATGSLKVEGPTYQKALYFRSGRVLFGSSNDPRDQLGAILIEDGRITPEQLEDVNSKVGPGNPLAKVLAETGFVSQRELSDAARAKVERILSDVIAYTSGTFEFEDGVLPKGAVDLKLSTERLILTAVRRISDRTFVLRHLEGLDVVLRPAADLAAVRTEVEGETGGLLPHLDGLSTLKDAAGRTRLDDFEAAKLACALLFLGAVERVGPGGAQAPMLDLAETAREAFGDEWTAPTPEPPPPPPRRRVGDDTIIAWGKIDPQAFAEPAAPAVAAATPPAVAHAAIAVEPEPANAVRAAIESAGHDLVIEPDAPAPEPAVAVERPAPAKPAVERPAPAPPPAAAASPALRPPTPPAPPAPRPEPPAAAERPPVATRIEPAAEPPTAAEPPAVSAPPPRITPHRVWTPPPATPEPVVRTSVSTARPSKDDMAALDALLGSRPVEGPLAPLERVAEPRYTPPARSVRARRGGGAPAWQKVALAGGFVAVAGLGFAGVWYLLKDRAPAGGTATVPPSAPPVTAAAAPVTTLPAPAVTVPSAPASLPPRPVAATPAPERPAAASGVDGARGLLRAGRLQEAAQGFAGHLRTAPASSASIQLLVACSPDTVQKAVAAVDAAELLILPVNFKGRDCFRMCWGLYGSAAAASSAVGSLPEYFIKGGASPRVMSRAELLQ